MHISVDLFAGGVKCFLTMYRHRYEARSASRKVKKAFGKITDVVRMQSL